jgi:hypothetical protein
MPASTAESTALHKFCHTANDGFWPGCRGANGCALPDSAWLEVWRRTVLQIRATDTSATIVGPSTNSFSLPFMAAFLNYSVANSVVPTMLDWHEFGNNGSDIPQHHAMMRQWLGVHHSSLAKIPIVISLSPLPACCSLMRPTTRTVTCGSWGSTHL